MKKLNATHQAIPLLKNPKIQLAELFVIIVLCIYAFLCPRDTQSDFIVFSIMSLLLYVCGKAVGLAPPATVPFGKLDKGLLLLTLSLVAIAWTTALQQEKLSTTGIQNAFFINLLYLYYAFIQHFLAQRYLTLRFYIYFKYKGPANSQKHPILFAALSSSVLFGALHITYPHLILIAAFGGFMYAYYFLKTGRLWAVVVSHALIASNSLYWLLDDNPFTELLWIIGY